MLSFQARGPEARRRPSLGRHRASGFGADVSIGVERVVERITVNRRNALSTV
jgi:hypothetical protein